MGVEENKQLVLSWWQSLLQGDLERCVQLLHDDFRFFMLGNLPISGWSDQAGFFDGVAMLAGQASGGITLRFGDITAEEDRVWCEMESDVPLSDGGRYNNTYVIAIRVRDGKIVELKEFSDTLHAYEVVDAPQTRGPRKVRESPLVRVTKEIQSAAPDLSSQS